MAKQDEYARYTIRIPAELYERLKASAGNKSVNAEIIARLEDSFTASDTAPLLDAALTKLVTRLDQETAVQREMIDFYKEQVGMMKFLIEDIADGGPVLDPMFHKRLKEMVETSRQGKGASAKPKD